MDEFAVSIEHSEAKSVSVSRGLRPLTPRPGALPWTPLGASPPDLRYRLALRALAMPPFVKSYWPNPFIHLRRALIRRRDINFDVDRSSNKKSMKLYTCTLDIDTKYCGL